MRFSDWWRYISNLGNDGDNGLEGNAADNMLTGGAGNDKLTGYGGNDTLLGGDGNDYLYGDGNPSLYGGDGDDTYNGGRGNDYFYDNVGDFGSSSDTYSFARGDGQDNIDDFGTRWNSTDRLQFGAGLLPSDVLLARDQNSLVLRITGSSDQITILSYFYVSPYNADGRIEQFHFADGTVWKTTAIDAWLASGNANVPTAGADTLMGTATNDTIAALAGDDTVSGSIGDDTLDGGAGVDNLFGNEGNDVLDGGTGADILAGGIGNDTYIVDNGLDDVIEKPNEGTDTVYSSVEYDLSVYNLSGYVNGYERMWIENLTLTGTAPIDGYGNDLNNVLTGNSANNRLVGGAGADLLLGGAGNDIYVIDDVGDSITEHTNEGSDTVESVVTYTLSAHVENLTLLDATPIDGTGNTLANTLTGNSANNTLLGDAGNDTLIGGAGDDTLDGGPGTDALSGGTGNDIYVVDNTGDRVTESANAGTFLSGR